MKIGFITQWYDPETGSAAIPGSIVRALQARGNRVDVVTGFPNYPVGKLYPGYRIRPLQREKIGSTDVARIPNWPSHDASGLRRGITYLAFMISAASLGAFLVRRAEVVLVYTTSATVAVSGVVARALYRRPYVLYIQDLWPDSVMASGMVRGRVGRIAERALHWLCDVGYRGASRIAVISPGLKEILISRGVPGDKIDVVYNWVDEEIFRPVVTTARGGAGFDLMYAGSMGDVQGLEVAVRAIATIDDPTIRLRMVGGGVAQPALAELAQDLGVADRVVFEGSRPLEDMAEVLSLADAQLVCLRDIPLFHATMPSKTQAILACGLPVVVSAPGDVARLVSDARAGLVAQAGDVEALAEAIRSAARMTAAERAALGANGRSFYERELSSVVGAARLEESLMKAKV